MLRMCAPYRLSIQVMGSKHLYSEVAPMSFNKAFVKNKVEAGGREWPPHILKLVIIHEATSAQRYL